MDQEIKFVFSADTSEGQAAIKRMTSSLSDMGNTGVAAERRLSDGAESMTGSFIKANLVLEAARKAWDLLVKTFQVGVAEMEETRAATSRLQATAELAGIAVEDLQKAADKISADHLLEVDVAMQGIADLAQKGFGKKEIDQLSASLKNVAAAAGGNVQENFQQLTEALVKNRFSGVNLNRMLPTLNAELKKLGVSMKDILDPTKAETVQQAVLNSVLSQGGRVANEAANRVNTLDGQMQALHIVAKDLAETFVTSVTQGFTKAHEGAINLADALTKLQPTIAKFGEWVGEAIGKIAGFLLQFSTGIQVIDATLDEEYGHMAAGFDQLMMHLSGGLADFLTAMGKLPGRFGEKAREGAVAATIGRGNFTLAMIEDFKKIETARATLDELGKSFEKLGKKEKETGDATDDFSKKLKPLTEEQKKLLATFEAQAKPFDALIDKFHEFEKVGVTAEQFGKVYSDSLLAAYQRQIELGEAVANTAENQRILNAAWTQWLTLQAKKSPFDKNLLAPATVNPRAIAGSTLGAGQAAGGLAREIHGTTTALDAYKLAAGQAASGTDSLRTAMEEAAYKASQYARMFGELGSIIGGTLGGVVSSVGAGFDAFSSILEQTGDKSKAVMGGIGQSMVALGSVIGGTAGQIVSSIGSVVTAFATMGPVGGIIAAVTAAFGILFKLLQKNWGKDVQHAINQFLPGLQFSDDLLKKLADDAKEFNNSAVALFVNLKAEMDDVGVSVNNVNTFIAELRNGFSLLQDGLISATQLVDVLNETFDELAKASMSATGIISNGMREIIQLTRVAGLEVEAISNFINDQLTKGFEGFSSVFNAWADRVQKFYEKLQKMQDGATKFQHDLTGAISQAKFNHFGREIVMWVNQMLASGMSVDEVMQLVGGDLDRLSEIAQQFGLSLDPALAELIELREESKKWGAVISGVNSQLVAMANVFENIDPANFKEVIKDLRPIFKDILADGKLTKAEFLSILPVLMTMIQMSQQFGIKLPKWVTDIITKAQGKNWLPKDLTTTVNVHYKTMDVDKVHAKEFIVAQYSGAGSSSGPGSGGGGQNNEYIVGQTSRSGGTRTRQQNATIVIQDRRQQTIKLVLGNSGVIELAKAVADKFADGSVQLPTDNLIKPIIWKG